MTYIVGTDGSHGYQIKLLNDTLVDLSGYSNVSLSFYLKINKTVIFPSQTIRTDGTLAYWSINKNTNSLTIPANSLVVSSNFYAYVTQNAYCQIHSGWIALDAIYRR